MTTDFDAAADLQPLGCLNSTSPGPRAPVLEMDFNGIEGMADENLDRAGRQAGHDVHLNFNTHFLLYNFHCCTITPQIPEALPRSRVSDHISSEPSTFKAGSVGNSPWRSPV